MKKQKRNLMMNRKNWTGFFMGTLAWILMTSLVQADVKVTNIEVKPRYPWNGLVDIYYSVSCDEKDRNGDDYEISTGLFKCHCRIRKDSGIIVPVSFFHFFFKLCKIDVEHQNLCTVKATQLICCIGIKDLVVGDSALPAHASD